MAVALTLTALVFIVQAVSYLHPDRQEQAACQLCQIAHAGILATATVCVPFVALVPNGTVEQPTVFIRQEEFPAVSPARAPPAEEVLL